MQKACVKTSLSIPASLLEWVKGEAEEGMLPVSRVIVAAVREKMERESKRRGRK